MSSDSLLFPLRRIAPESTAQIARRVRQPALSDEELMELVQQGNHSAFEELFDRYHAIVRSVASRVLRTPEDIADVVQEAFIDVYQNCGSFDASKGSVRTWICSVSRHRAIRKWHQLKSRNWQESVEDSGEAELADSSPVEWIRSIDYRNCLDEVLRSLSENQRKTLLLYFFEGFELDEIAAALGESRSNVRHYLYRGLARLRRELADSRMLSGYAEFGAAARKRQEAI